MRLFATMLTIIVVSCCTGIFAHAAEFHVNQDGSGDFTVIQQAIVASVDGDVIIVHPGTYYENVRFEGKNIALRATDPEDWAVVEATVIDGGQNGSVVAFDGIEDAMCELRGLTITNGAGEMGGGILGGRYTYMEVTSTRAKITNCMIVDNEAVNGGGGIFNCAGAIRNCLISGNRAWFGGGICQGRLSALEVSECVVTNNSAGEGGGFGALSDCEVRISRCTITGNRASESGGGVFSYSPGAIAGCEIRANEAAHRGGGIAVESDQLTVRDCTIADNAAIEGGGIHLLDANGIGMFNCRLTSNSAMLGGGMHLAGVSALSLSNLTFSMNRADRGGGIYSESRPPDRAISVSNSILRSDSPDELYFEQWEEIAVSYSCVEGGFSGDGNMNQDPLLTTGFYLSQTASGQPADSPCINAGLGDASASGLSEYTTRTDGAGDDGVVDMGFHYSQGNACPVLSDAGVIPETGTPGTLFIFWACYSDVDGDAPVGLTVEVDEESSLCMSLRQGTGDDGIYACSTRLLPGQHSFYIHCEDRCGASARYPEAGALEGPFVSGDPVTDYYVDAQRGDDSAGGGSMERPWKTISFTLERVHGTPASPVTVHVGSGTYNTAMADGAPETFPLALKSYVSIVGDGAAETIISADGSERVMFADRVTRVCVEGVTLRGGYSDDRGGGVSCIDSALSLVDCVIDDNHSYSEGGGLNSMRSSVALLRCVISNNGAGFVSSGDGGGGGGMQCELSYVTMRDCSIEFNEAPERGCGGGGVRLLSSSGAISTCSFVGNHAESGGAFQCERERFSLVVEDSEIAENTSVFVGGILIEGNDDCEITVKNCLISANSSTYGTGGIACYCCSVVGCTITNNKGQYGGGGVTCGGSLLSDCVIEGNFAPFGGGIFGSGGSWITNCVIQDNRGSGIYYYVGGAPPIWAQPQGFSEHCGKQSLASDEPPGIRNCLIIHNEGDGVACYQFASARLSNVTIAENSLGLRAVYYSNIYVVDSIIWGNETPDIEPMIDSTITIEHSCVEAGYKGPGNISQDPLFATGPLGDYYLDPNSPCINAGNKSSEEAGLSDKTTQADGTPDTGIVDMGYHYPISEAPIEAQVYCSLNAAVFAPGDLMQGYLGVENPGVEATVDVFVGFILPGGSIVCLAQYGFEFGLWPWVSDCVLPMGFSYGPEIIFELGVPQVEPGSYIYAAALAESGWTGFKFVSVDSVPLAVSS